MHIISNKDFLLDDTVKAIDPFPFHCLPLKRCLIRGNTSFLLQQTLQNPVEQQKPPQNEKVFYMLMFVI